MKKYEKLKFINVEIYKCRKEKKKGNQDNLNKSRQFKTSWAIYIN